MRWERHVSHPARGGAIDGVDAAQRAAGGWISFTFWIVLAVTRC